MAAWTCGFRDPNRVPAIFGKLSSIVDPSCVRLALTLCRSPIQSQPHQALPYPLRDPVRSEQIEQPVQRIETAQCCCDPSENCGPTGRQQI